MNKCEICGKMCGKNPHHIITRGAYGGHRDADNPDNLIWLCGFHHLEVHTIGRESFFTKWGLEHRLEVAKEAYRKHNGGMA